MAVADLVVVMNHGRIEQSGAARDVFDRPRTEFVARFIGGHNIVPLSGPTGALTAVRADRMRLSREALPAADRVLPATVRGVEYQGSYVLLTLASDRVPEFNVVLSERDFDAAPWQPGDRACALWDATDMHVLAA